jgi:hypothetical protein
MLHIWRIIWWWIEVHTGTTNEPGPYYGFWSGFGSDIGEIAIIGAVLGTYKHHNCSVPRCPRLAHKKYEVKEIKEYTCKKHHTEFWEALLIKQYKIDYPAQYKHINKKGKK